MEAPSKSWLMSKKPGAYLLPGLRRLREEREFSVRGLAREAEISPDSVWRLETLRRGAESKTRRKLAKALKASIKDLRTPDEEVDES